MSMPIPQQAPGVAVDPSAVLSVLRQQHAQTLDGLNYQVALLTAALNDAQATIGELRIRAEELATQNAELTTQNGELRAAAEGRAVNAKAKVPTAR